MRKVARQCRGCRRFRSRASSSLFLNPLRSSYAVALFFYQYCSTDIPLFLASSSLFLSLRFSCAVALFFYQYSSTDFPLFLAFFVLHSTPVFFSYSQSTEPWRYFNVVWCKYSNKKHKKWEGDALLMVRNSTAVLKDMEGKDISKSATMRAKDLETLSEGESLTFSGKEVEIMGKVSAEDWATGKCFKGGTTTSSIGGAASGRSWSWTEEEAVVEMMLFSSVTPLTYLVLSQAITWPSQSVLVLSLSRLHMARQPRKR